MSSTFFLSIPELGLKLKLLFFNLDQNPPVLLDKLNLLTAAGLLADEKRFFVLATEAGE